MQELSNLSPPARPRLNGIPRRDFLSLCAAVAGVLGLGPGGIRKVQAALATGLRQPVLWLHFAECTGCTESLLRSTSPYFDDLILKSISLDYHETVMVESGQGAEDLRAQILAKYSGDFLCVVEGSIPTANNGSYGTIGSQTMYAIAAEVLPKAKAIITIGSCSSDGGVAAAAPNPAGARGVSDAFPGLKVPVIKCPGCPPNPVNFVAIIADYLLKGTTPPLDSAGRPAFAYGKTVHQLCGLLGTANCLQSKGCRGIATFHNCPQAKFNEGTSYCQQAGHVCIGCAEAGFWDAGAFWGPTFWKTYDVKVDAGKSGISYSGNPDGIVSTRGGAADAGAAGAGGSVGTGGTSGTGGAPGSGGASGSGGLGGGGGSGHGGGTGAGGTLSSGGAQSTGGASGAGGSSAGGGSSGTGGASGSGGGPGAGGGSGPGVTTAPHGSSPGGGCDIGARASNRIGTLGTVAALSAVAVRILRAGPQPRRQPAQAAQQEQGDACPASSSTPSPESKDT
jgi:[NiFe] hydrogenase small subunit